MDELRLFSRWLRRDEARPLIVGFIVAGAAYFAGYVLGRLDCG